MWGDRHRLVRQAEASIVAFFHHLVHTLHAPTACYEVLDGMAVATRDAKRRGAGWLPSVADVGWCTRLGG
jgi:hypothetical protein